MAERQRLREVWSVASMILLQNEVAQRGNIACLQTSSGKVVVGAVAAGLIPIGTFMETKTPTGADGVVKVELFREVKIDRFVNDGATPVVVGDVGSNCYVKDGATVTGDSTGASVAGKVWGVDAVKGVAVQMVAT